MLLGGRYQIITQLARGGFGATFIAADMQRPGNPHCVVKQLQPQASDSFTLRIAKLFFDQEAEILETLGKHDQIPQLLAYFEENQEFYLVQEFIEGHDLTQEIPHNKPLGETQVVKLLKDTLEVLEFVHQHKVIHRDIKPSNIRRRQDGKIVLIDFGAVKQVKGLQVNPQGETTFTVPIGTPGYMPSEQAKGDPKLSSDVYALGVICIEALTGINPDPRRGGGLPTHPDTGEIVWRDRVKVNPQLASVLDKMVRYDFRQRYPSATDALQAVTGLSSKLPFWKAWIGGGIAAAVIIGIFISSHLMSTKNNLLTYKNYNNSTYGIKIKYPETWYLQNLENPVTGEVVTFLSPKQNQANKSQENLTIRVLENYSGTLEQSTDFFTREITHLSEYKIIDKSSTILANKAANQLVYTGKNLKNLQVWTLQGDRVYIITYSAAIDDYNKFMQTAEEMIKSFEISAP